MKKLFPNFRIWLPLLLAQLAGVAFYLLFVPGDVPGAHDAAQPYGQQVWRETWFSILHRPLTLVADLLGEAFRFALNWLWAVIYQFGWDSVLVPFLLWLIFLFWRYRVATQSLHPRGEVSENTRTQPRSSALAAIVVLLKVGMLFGVLLVLPLAGSLLFTFMGDVGAFQFYSTDSFQEFSSAYLVRRHGASFVPVLLVLVMAAWVMVPRCLFWRRANETRKREATQLIRRLMWLSLLVAGVAVAVLALQAIRFVPEPFVPRPDDAWCTIGLLGYDCQTRGGLHWSGTLGAMKLAAYYAVLPLAWLFPGLIAAFVWSRRRPTVSGPAQGRWEFLIVAPLLAVAMLASAAGYYNAVAKAALQGVDAWPDASENISLTPARPMVLVDIPAEERAKTQIKWIPTMTGGMADGSHYVTVPDYIAAIRRMAGTPWVGSVIVEEPLIARLVLRESVTNAIDAAFASGDVAHAAELYAGLIEAAGSLVNNRSLVSDLIVSLQTHAHELVTDEAATRRIVDLLQKLHDANLQIGADIERYRRLWEIQHESRFRRGEVSLPVLCFGSSQLGLHPVDAAFRANPVMLTLLGSSERSTKRHLDAMARYRLSCGPAPVRDPKWNKMDGRLWDLGECWNQMSHLGRGYGEYAFGDDPVAKLLMASSCRLGPDWRIYNARLDWQCADLQLTRLDLAFLLCLRTHGGRPPAALDNLVPEFLPTMPSFHPYSVGYFTEGTNWAVYAKNGSYGGPQPEHWDAFAGKVKAFLTKARSIDEATIARALETYKDLRPADPIDPSVPAGLVAGKHEDGTNWTCWVKFNTMAQPTNYAGVVQRWPCFFQSGEPSSTSVIYMRRLH